MRYGVFYCCGCGQSVEDIFTKDNLRDDIARFLPLPVHGDDRCQGCLFNRSLLSRDSGRH